MKGPKRKSYNEEGHSHLLTFSCYRRRKFFSQDEHKDLFVENLARARERLGFKIEAYAVMPEHVHLLVRPQDGVTVAQILQSVKQPVSLRLRHKMPGNPPVFWQPGGGHDRNVYTRKATAAVIEYVHNNPCERGLARTQSEYRWSSASWYESRTGPLPIDVYSPYG